MNLSEFNDKKQEISLHTKPTIAFYTLSFMVDGIETPVSTVSVKSIEMDIDYATKYGHSLVVTAYMSLGQYIRKLHANRNKKITAILTQEFTAGYNVNEKINIAPNITKYRAFIYEEADLDFIDKHRINLDHEFMYFKFELIDQNLYDIRTLKISTVFKETSYLDILKLMLMKSTKRLPPDLQAKGVWCYPANNTEVPFQTIVKVGTKVTELHRLLQSSGYGIYNHDISMHYCTKLKHWFIFPTYNPNQHEQSPFHLDVYIVNDIAGDAIRNTWKYTESKKRRLSILSVGGLNSIETKQYDYLNQGNGVRFLKGEKLFNEYSSVDSNVMTIGTDHIANFCLENRLEDLQLSEYATPKVTNNVCKQLSNLSMRDGKLVSFKWSNARPDLLVPGMPVTINQITESNVRRYKGVLHGVIGVASKMKEGITDGPLIYDVILKAFIKDYEDI